MATASAAVLTVSIAHEYCSSRYVVAAFVYMAVGYVVCNLIWPNFYFEPIEMGKDVWLAGQLIGIAFYVSGIVFAFGGIRRHHLESGAVISATR